MMSYPFHRLLDKAGCVFQRWPQRYYPIPHTFLTMWSWHSPWWCGVWPLPWNLERPLQLSQPGQYCGGGDMWISRLDHKNAEHFLFALSGPCTWNQLPCCEEARPVHADRPQEAVKYRCFGWQEGRVHITGSIHCRTGKWQCLQMPEGLLWGSRDGGPDDTEQRQATPTVRRPHSPPTEPLG